MTKAEVLAVEGLPNDHELECASTFPPHCPDFPDCNCDCRYGKAIFALARTDLPRMAAMLKRAMDGLYETTKDHGGFTASGICACVWCEMVRDWRRGGE